MVGRACDPTSTAMESRTPPTTALTRESSQADRDGTASGRLRQLSRRSDPTQSDSDRDGAAARVIDPRLSLFGQGGFENCNDKPNYSSVARPHLD
jgi:hypothetical protein